MANVDCTCFRNCKLQPQAFLRVFLKFRQVTVTADEAGHLLGISPISSGNVGEFAQRFGELVSPFVTSGCEMVLIARTLADRAATQAEVASCRAAA